MKKVTKPWIEEAGSISKSDWEKIPKSSLEAEDLERRITLTRRSFTHIIPFLAMAAWSMPHQRSRGFSTATEHSESSSCFTGSCHSRKQKRNRMRSKMARKSRRRNRR